MYECVADFPHMLFVMRFDFVTFLEKHIINLRKSFEFNDIKLHKDVELYLFSTGSDFCTYAEYVGI